MTWKRVGEAILIVAAIFTIIGVFIAIIQFAKPTPPSSPQPSSTSQGRTGIMQSPSTPTPTPTSQVLPINQTSSCTNCFNTDLSLIVKNATIDPANSQVTLLIGVRNNSTTTISPYMNSLKLQDTQTGVSVNGGGDGFKIIFPITPNQTVLFHPTFQFVPVAGHEYSLSAELSSQYDFSPITIKF